jgi:hypothetical protein
LKKEKKMMKRLLILMLVLGISSLAGATLTLQVAPDVAGSPGAFSDLGLTYTVSVSDYIWIGVYSDLTGTTTGASGKYSGTIDIKTNDGINGSWTGAYGIAAPPVTITGASASVDSVLATFSNTAADTQICGPGLGFWFRYHCDGVGTEFIKLKDAGSKVDEVTIHQEVPEPLTLALLGLGGLFLRRRK